MSRDKMTEWRLEGMYYAHKQIKEHGLEAFEEELQFRSKFGVSALVTKKELMAQFDNIINHGMQVILVFAIAVLHDEFGFGAERCNRFIERFNLKASCLAEDYLKWDEQVKIIEDEIGIEVKFR